MSAYSGEFINANGTAPPNGTSGGGGGNSTSPANATSTAEEDLSAETASFADTSVNPTGLAAGVGVTGWLVVVGLAVGGGLVLLL